MKRSLDGGWAGYGVMIIWLILFGYLMISGCAPLQKLGITIETPTTQALTKGLLYEAGLIIGEEDTALAEELLEYTQIDRDDLDTFYLSWKRYLASKLTKKPRYQRLIRLALSAVDVRLEFKTSEEQNKIIKELFREFRAGLQAGIESHN